MTGLIAAPVKRLVRFGRTVRESKFKNRGCIIDNHKFPSQREGKRYLQLKLLQANGELRNLRLQVEYRCIVNDVLVCKYRADFVFEEYRNGAWSEVVEDVKGYRTPEYRLKRKLMKACHAIEIRET